MKSTVVDESLSSNKTNVLFQRISAYFNKEKKFIKIEAPFMNEISGHAIVKMIDSEGQCTVVLKLKFIRNCASLEMLQIIHKKQ